jgi:hypothetical protein
MQFEEIECVEAKRRMAQTVRGEEGLGVNKRWQIAASRNWTKYIGARADESECDRDREPTTQQLRQLTNQAAKSRVQH